MIWFLKLTFIVVLTFSLLLEAAPRPSPLPWNVSYSFALGITDNNGLSREDLHSLAASAYYMTEAGLTFDDAHKKLEKQTDQQLKSTATRNFYVEYIVLTEAYLSKITRFTSKNSEHFPDEAELSPLRFQQDGVNYVRLFIHPLRKDRRFLRWLGNPPIRRGRFIAQLTESRSMVVFDSVSQGYWSIKTSLPNGIGKYKDKAYKSDGSIEQVNTSDRLVSIQKETGLADTLFFAEIQAIGVRKYEVNYKTGEFYGIDEGQSARRLKHFENGRIFINFATIYTMGLKPFVGEVSDAELRRLEKKWLSTELAKADATIYEASGLYPSSNHSQNGGLLFEPDHTVVGVIRRDPDFDLDLSHPKANLSKNSLRESSQRESAQFNFSMLAGFKSKSFYGDQRAGTFATDYYQQFYEYYHQLRGHPKTSYAIQPRKHIFLNSTPPYGHYTLYGADFQRVVVQCLDLMH